MADAPGTPEDDTPPTSSAPEDHTSPTASAPEADESSGAVGGDGPEAQSQIPDTVDEALAETDAVMSDIDLMKQERDDYLDALRRLQADFENFRKRTMKHQTDVLERAAQGLVEKLLPVLDAADLAVAHGADAAVGQVSGLLLDTLVKEGLEGVDPKPGDPFDPTLHEAVAHEPGEGDGQEVVDLLRAGYRWKGTLLRPAMVKVRG